MELKSLRKITKLYYLILTKEEKSLLLLLVVKVDLEILDLKVLQIELQENLLKVELEKSLQFGFN